MPLTPRIPDARDYTNVPKGVGTIERDQKIACCLMGMRVVELQLGEASALYRYFQARAIAWASN